MRVYGDMVYGSCCYPIAQIDLRDAVMEIEDVV